MARRTSATNRLGCCWLHSMSGAWRAVMVDPSSACLARCVFAKERLEFGIVANGIPDWLQSQRVRRDGRWHDEQALEFDDRRISHPRLREDHGTIQGRVECG